MVQHGGSDPIVRGNVDHTASMTASVAWSDLSIVGGFLAGFLVGVVVAIRLVRVVGSVIRRERDD